MRMHTKMRYKKDACCKAWYAKVRGGKRSRQRVAKGTKNERCRNLENEGALAAGEAPRCSRALESGREGASRGRRQAVCARGGTQEAGGGVRKSAAALIGIFAQARSARAAR